MGLAAWAVTPFVARDFYPRKHILAWKYSVTLILQENDLENFVKESVAELAEDEAKTKFKKNMIKAKRIIVDSIKTI